MNDNEEWREIAGGVLRGIVPQALAVVIPGSLAGEFRDEYARRALCVSGSGEDRCVSCAAWAGDGHPDLVIAGTWGKPPGIEDCLALSAELSLHPVAAPFRLAAICEADSLSLPAANSLLKLIEEPPANARILLVSETENLIPTIRSRVWMLRLRGKTAGAAAEAPPGSAEEWACFLERGKSKETPDLQGWVQWFIEREEWETAACVKNVLSLAEKRRIPFTMIQDALYAILKEGIECEEIFGDLREA